MTVLIEFVPRDPKRSGYDWADLSVGKDRVGKVRCTIDGRTIVIYSINIYPAFEGHGYGREFVNYCKRTFPVVIADRVRHSALGFWETMGFTDDRDGNWSCRR